MKDSDVYRVEIISGFTIYGTHALKFTEEGLLCRTTDDKWKEKVRFFTLSELDKKKVFQLQCFLMTNSYYFSNDTVIDESRMVFDGRMPLRIIIRKGWGNFVKIKYVDNIDDCDLKLDSLVKLTNATIPEKYKKDYLIKGVDSCK